MIDDDCCREPLVARAARLLLGGALVRGLGLYAEIRARAQRAAIRGLIVVILRGALDGLATVAPIGDPDYAGLHGIDRARARAAPSAALRLDAFFALHPAMPEFARHVSREDRPR